MGLNYNDVNAASTDDTFIAGDAKKKYLKILANYLKIKDRN